uniref:DRBM domain-containing protein n=1 Tax=Strix occidentalis caurina TaxID=311401 RepID=A0A8D0FNC7_STROC
MRTQGLSPGWWRCAGGSLKVGCGMGIHWDPKNVSCPPPYTMPPLTPSAPRRGTPLEMKTPVSPPQSECNPVGALQELVVQKGWRLPEYTVTQESGPAHRKEFTMTCRVERFVEIGTGPGHPRGDLGVSTAPAFPGVPEPSCPLGGPHGGSQQLPPS